MSPSNIYVFRYIGNIDSAIVQHRNGGKPKNILQRLGYWNKGVKFDKPNAPEVFLIYEKIQHKMKTVVIS